VSRGARGLARRGGKLRQTAKAANINAYRRGELPAPAAAAEAHRGNGAPAIRRPAPPRAGYPAADLRVSTLTAAAGRWRLGTSGRQRHIHMRAAPSTTTATPLTTVIGDSHHRMTIPIAR